MTPYPFQQVYLADVDVGWKLARRQLVVSPTGSGKTNMFAWVAEAFTKAGKRVLILVDQNNLLEQTVERIQRVIGIKPEVEQAKNFASLTAQVVVGSVQTMFRKERLERWAPDHFDLVIADEADKSISDSWQTVLKHFDGHAMVAGFTATPNRTDQRNLGCYYDRVIEKESLVSLQAKGFLCPITIHQCPIRLDLSSVHVKDGDYNEKELDEIIGPHLEQIAKEIQEHAAFRKTVVFLPLVKTAKKFAGICRDIGLSADFTSGKDPLRDEKWERFKRWDFDILANSMLLTRGVDDPAIDCVVPCRPTKSITLYFQMVGRGTRIAAGKSGMLLFDFLYQAHTHLICRPARLVARDEFEAQQITEMIEKSAGLPADVVEQLPLDLGKLATDAASQREEALRKRLEEVKKNRLKVIGPEEFALLHQTTGWKDYKPATPEEAQEPTDKQMKWLRKVKVNPASGKVMMHYAPGSWPSLDLSQITSRGQASKILDLAFANKHTGVILASPKQRELLRRMGHSNPDNATAHEARQWFADRRKPKQSAFAL